LTNTRDWILRFIKGMIIGSGFILPGVSGGALAAVLGLYERIIEFLANPFRNLRESFLFFLPVGLGGLSGVFLLSIAIAYFLGAYEAQILWLFAGCIIGTLPALWRQSGERGRRRGHMLILAAAAVFGYILLLAGEASVADELPQTMLTWLIAGAIVGLGAIIPGLSSSNFLVYLGLYQPMAEGIRDLNFSVILPLALGGIVCVLIFSKAMNYILRHAYTGLYHAIIGIVIASTVMIIPFDYDYSGMGLVVCIILFAVGILAGRCLTRLESKKDKST